jgi:hypothetical protein
MNLNLILAVFWLIVAAVAFASGPGLALHLGGIEFSGGWLAIVLALYNVGRWWSTRTYRRLRQAEREAQAQLDRRRREERREPAEPDPNFKFTDPPAGSSGGPQPG